MREPSIGDMNNKQLREWKKALGIKYDLFDNHHTPQCVTCGKPYEQAYDSIAKKKTKYLWKPTCKCIKKNIRLAIL